MWLIRGECFWDIVEKQEMVASKGIYKEEKKPIVAAKRPTTTNQASFGEE